MADLTNFAFVKEWDITQFKKTGTFKFTTPEEIENWKKETCFKYYPVVYTGMGFMAVKKEVLDKMTYPYFDSEKEVIECENGVVISDICSEDVAFSKNIIKAGYQIMINTDIRVGHIKPLVI
jgi:predicted aspartyl protease